MIKYIAIIIIIAILVAGFAYFSLFRRGATKPMPEATKQIAVVATNPQDGESEAGSFSPITVVFSSAVSQEGKQSLRVSSDPAIKTTISWADSDKALIITPTEPLQANTKYALTVDVQGLTHTWSFTTTDLSPATQQEIAKAQTTADKKYADEVAEIYKKYPWYNKLPIEEKNYFVYFDTENAKFIAKLYPQKNSQTNIDDQVSTMKTEVESKIKAISADASQYPIDWKIIPE